MKRSITAKTPPDELLIACTDMAGLLGIRRPSTIAQLLSELHQALLPIQGEAYMTEDDLLAI